MEEGGRVQKVRVPDEGLTIGRKPAPYGASYCTTNTAVSRQHCRLAKLGDGWFVEDLGSANGTLVNNESAVGETPVKTGDLLVIGGVDAGLKARFVTTPKLFSGETLDDEAEATAISSGLTIDKVRATYDIVAERYAEELGEPMISRPLERGMLLAYAQLVTEMGAGLVGDVGCGPGLVSKHLHELGLSMVGYDISPGMIAQARKRFPQGLFHVGSMLELPVERGAWNGAVSMWALLHSPPEERTRVFAELHRVIAHGGYVFHSFYVSGPDQPEGSVFQLNTWFGFPVDLPTYFAGIEDTALELDRAGFEAVAVLVREPMTNDELPTRRCYMIGKRR